MPCSRVFSVSLARCAVTKVTDVSLASREIAASTAPGPHEIDPTRPLHRPACHARHRVHADRGCVVAVTKVTEVRYASREIVACDTLKVRATSACASPLASRWRASWR